MRFSLFILLFSGSIFAQIDYPKDYFRSPLDIPMQLSGNFGELRPNHFHAGFDLKTLQKVMKKMQREMMNKQNGIHLIIKIGKF